MLRRVFTSPSSCGYEGMDPRSYRMYGGMYRAAEHGIHHEHSTHSVAVLNGYSVAQSMVQRMATPFPPCYPVDLREIDRHTYGAAEGIRPRTRSLLSRRPEVQSYDHPYSCPRHPVVMREWSYGCAYCLAWWSRGSIHTQQGALQVHHSYRHTYGVAEGIRPRTHCVSVVYRS